MKLEKATSIRRKLNFIVLATTLLSLLIAGFALMAFDLGGHVRATRHDLETQADVLALASQAALSFLDPEAATEGLRSLQAKPSAVAAGLYDAQGRLFASYLASPTEAPLPLRVPPLGLNFDAKYAEVVRPVLAKQEAVGSIYIRSEHQFVGRFVDYLAVLGVIILASLAAGLALSNRLQRAVTQPIMAISHVAKGILRGDTHEVRAAKTSDDEVGDLVEAFNAMLEELGQRAGRLEESNRSKDRFLATLAHELRNPLAPIRTGLEILKKDTANGPASQKARATMERQVTHMVHLIDDLLDISRVNTGKIKLEREKIRLHLLVEAALEASGPLVEAAGQTLDVELPPQDIELTVDPVRLVQALSNVLSNASKYTPTGGRIRLHATVADGQLHFHIQDNGVGIRSDDLDRVFSLFAQVGSSQGRSQGGLGIGLFLVRSIVELHGGSVTVSSDGLGLGSCFTISLPVPPEAVAAAAAQAAPANLTPAALGLHRILVVDDNTDAANTLAELLRLLGHTIMVVHDGPAALRATAAFNPDLVVLDIGMPGMDGYEVARRLKCGGPFKPPMLVAATGWGSDADRAKAAKAGFDHHLTKPVEIGQLDSIIRTVEPLH